MGTPLHAFKHRGDNKLYRIQVGPDVALVKEISTSYWCLFEVHRLQLQQTTLTGTNFEETSAFPVTDKSSKWSPCYFVSFCLFVCLLFFIQSQGSGSCVFVCLLLLLLLLLLLNLGFGGSGDCCFRDARFLLLPWLMKCWTEHHNTLLSFRQCLYCFTISQTGSTWRQILSGAATFEAPFYCPQTPQSPLVRPAAHDELAMDTYPLGTNAVVAVISYTVSRTAIGLQLQLSLLQEVLLFIV